MSVLGLSNSGGPEIYLMILGGWDGPTLDNRAKWLSF
jgi:hypothetical protein